MPNLQQVAEDPQALEQSVERMMGQRAARGEVVMNHGIRNAQELQEWVARPAALVDEEVYRSLLEKLPHG